MNRALYLDPHWFERRTLGMDPARLQELNGQFATAVANFFTSA